MLYLFAAGALPNQSTAHALCRLASCLSALAILSLSGCGDATSETKPIPLSRNQESQSICLDRLLVDVAAEVQVGAAVITPSGKGEYDFPGLANVAAGGVTWKQIELIEYQPGSVEDLANLAKNPRTRLLEQSYGYESAIGTAEGDIKHLLTGRIPKAETVEERAALLGLVQIHRQRVSAAKRFKLISGETKLDASAFAFRRDDDFEVGFRDAEDGRIRTFSGKLLLSAPENPEAAAEQYALSRAGYHRRMPTSIPSGAGYCTAYGLVDEATSAPLPKADLEIPFRSLKYPNLIFILFVSPHYGGPGNIRDNAREMMDSVPVEIGERRTHGPKHVTILGEPGLMFARENGPNCYHDQCMSANSAYVIEAKTLGQPDRPDKPELKLRMLAALPDDAKAVAKAGTEFRRPGLKGLSPPPYEEGEKIFKEVLASIRVRPGAMGPNPRYAPEAASGATPR